MLKKSLPAAYLLLSLLWMASPFSSAFAEDTAFETRKLTISTAGGDVEFTVEMALTERQQEDGLMFRTHLDDRHGMLFDFRTPRPVNMWMKNTLIPLDMIFIDNRGIISQIAAKTVPESTDLITAKTDARAVLEIAGGAVQKYHIAINDRVHGQDFP